MDIDDIRRELEETYAAFKGGSIDLKTAAELHNGLGKRISLEKAHLAYRIAKESSPALGLPFWDDKGSQKAALPAPRTILGKAHSGSK